MSDVTFDFVNDSYMDVHYRKNEPWKVSLIDTGESTETAGRLLRVQEYLIMRLFVLLMEMVCQI